MKKIIVFLLFSLFTMFVSEKVYSFSEDELFESRKIKQKSECAKLGNSEEIHLIIIWSLAMYQKKAILNDIQNTENLKILNVYKAAWEKSDVHENYNTMYELKNIGPQKEIDSGNGPFLIVVLLDQDPHYKIDEYHECNNTKLFELKHRFRRLSGVRWGIHATASPLETEKNLMFLLNKHYKSYIEKKELWDGKIQDLGIINNN